MLFPALSFFVAFFIVILLSKPMIQILQKWQIGQVIRQEGPQSHYSKKGTPTMGGLLIIFATGVASVLFANWHSSLVWMSLMTLFSFSAIGFYDDYKKLVLKHSNGLAARWKYFWQSLFALMIAFWFMYFFKTQGQDLSLLIPFSPHYQLILLPAIFIVLIYFTITGSSNAVNLTDGLDGLAILSALAVALGFLMIILLSSTLDSTTKALLPVLTALLGAGLGFWWLNGFPALLFMGDVGALGIGAFLAFIAIALRAEFFLVIMGGVFILETMSVILQVGSYKLRNKKRIFRMAPLHHHFELGGSPEPRVVARFTIITILLVVFALLGFA